MEPCLLNLFLLQLFDLTTIAPHLETLELVSQFDWRNSQLPANLERLDQATQYHTSLKRVILVLYIYGSTAGKEFEDEMKKCMPRCAKRDMIAFGLKDARRST